MKLANNILLKIQRIIMKGPIREGGRNAYVDWIIILFLSIILTVILIINGIYLFSRINNGEIKGEGLKIATTTEVIDIKGMDYIIEKINTKEALLNTAKKSFQTVLDPSI
jgi:hypothetical protein